MKKAFTLLEIIFVIVVVGILAVVIVPRFGSTNLNDAATQVVSHIRYAQHLAMSDDKYDTSDSIWFEKKWRIKFSNSDESLDKWSYTIFDDRVDTASGQPDADEIAVNPVDKNKKLTGGCAGISTTDSRATKEMNIGSKYGVSDISFSSSVNFTISM